MEYFQAIQPSKLLTSYVKQYWFLSAEKIVQGSQRAVPIGCMGLVFNRGGNVRSEDGLLPESYLFGQSTSYTDTYFGNLNLIVVLFQPIGAKAFFKMPMNEFNSQSVAIDVLSDPLLVELEKRIMDCVDNQMCVKWIEYFLMKRINSFEEYNFERLNSVLQSINYGENEISKLAQTACLGYKQFKRIFVEYAGLNPKEFLKITRFTNTTQKLQSHPLVSLNELADVCGYYDKSHLIKEFKTFAGYTPSEFLANCDPYSDYKSLFQSFFINTTK